MIRQLSTALLAAALAAAANPLEAQSETVTVTYEVREINEMDFSGDTGPLVVTQTSAGGAPADAVDESTTWTVTTNQAGRKITGALDSDLPPGVTLRIALTAPAGGARGRRQLRLRRPLHCAAGPRHSLRIGQRQRPRSRLQAVGQHGSGRRTARQPDRDVHDRGRHLTRCFHD